MPEIKKQKGFLLVELIVAIGIFVVIVLIGIGAIINIINANRKVRMTQISVDNISSILEKVTKDARLAVKYYCPTVGSYVDCPDGEETFSYESANGTITTFRKDGDFIQEEIGSGNGFHNINSPDVKIESLKFYSYGIPSFDANNPSKCGGSDCRQPRVIVVIRGYSEVKDIRSDFMLQTSFTMLNLDSVK